MKRDLFKKKRTTTDLWKIRKAHVPNALTAKTIDDAHKGIGLCGSINDVDEFIRSI